MAYGSAGQGGLGAGGSVFPHESSDHSVLVPDAELLFTAQFHRAGPDLVLTGRDGQHHLIPGYFSSEHHPALVAPNGAHLSPDLVDLLAGSPTPGHYAQAQPVPPPDAIGKIEKVVGDVTVVRNGVAVALHVGDAVFKSDVVQTGSQSMAGIGFPDGTALNLVANTRMALSDYSYDPNGTSNGALFNLVEGTFQFVAGKVAHTGDMKIVTPMATMGIRGTTGFVEDHVGAITSNQGDVHYYAYGLFNDFDPITHRATDAHGAYDITVLNPDGTNTQFTVSDTRVEWDVMPGSPGQPPRILAVPLTDSKIAELGQTFRDFLSAHFQVNPGQTNGSTGSSTPPDSPFFSPQEAPQFAPSNNTGQLANNAPPGGPPPGTAPGAPPNTISAPVADPSHFSTTEDTAYVFKVADFKFTGNDSADTLTSVIITSLPTDGTLELNGNAVTANEGISEADIASGKLTFVPNTDTVTQGTFSFKVIDAEAQGSSPNAAAMTITIAPDAGPTAVASSINATENTTYTFKVADFGFSDPADATPDTLGSVTITSLPTDGTLELNGSAVTANETISAADIANGKLTFVPNTDTVTQGTFDFKVTDAEGNTLSANAATMSINIATAGLVATGVDVSATEGNAVTATVATFTDANPLATTADFTATITWGDGTTSTGTITEKNGVFSVTGTHTYTEEGSDPIGVAITDVHGGGAGTTSTATVADAVLTATGVDVSAIEGNAVTATVATFTDANPLATTADFTATITWGDGTTSTGTITEKNGVFSVTGTHTYTDESNPTDPIGVTIKDEGGSTASTTSTATVVDAALTATGVDVSAIEGNAVTATVATFTDANPLATTDDFTATITWGDGTTSTGTITEKNGVFSVTGTHTYTDESTDPISVTIKDEGGSTASTTSTATVVDAALTATGVNVSAIEGNAVTATVATFTDANPLATTADFTATITWGDGTTSTGTITEKNGVFSVAGTHTYTDEKTDPIHVTINDDGGQSATADSTATVADAVLVATGVDINAIEGNAVTATVATFTDANPLATTADFTATITWGDGTTSTGTITEKNGVFSVTGTHTYTDESTDPISVTIKDDGGQSASTTSTATVADAVLTATGVDVSAIEGNAVTATVATFTDANPLATTADFTATITWGDGTTSTGTITEKNGVFSVTGTHTYTDESTDPISVTIKDDGGSTASTTSTATVADAALTATGVDVSAIEGNAVTATVATFTDANPLATTADFTATITWGDGTTSTGTITEKNGVFSVTGTHTYTDESTDPISVTIKDDGGQSASTTSTATVADAVLTATGVDVSAIEGNAVTATVATFTDANPLATTADFTATITWGDGTTSTGTITEKNGVFSVTGTHTYTDESTDPISVTIKDDGGQSASTTSTATVADAVLTATGVSVNATEGNVVTATVATFTDANPLATTADFTATITWGDGTTSTGTITEKNGVFSVAGTHTYAEEGSEPIGVTIKDDGGITASTTSTATVDPVAEKPDLGGATSASVHMGGLVTLGVTDTPFDSDDTLGSVTITGMPHDLSDFNGGHYTASSGTWTGTAAQFNALTFAAGHTTGTFTLSISAPNTTPGETATATENYKLTIDSGEGHELPILGGATSATVNTGGSVTLGVTETKFDSDDTLGTVTITSLPHDLSNFNGGHYTASSGTWTGTAAQFAALTFDAGNTTGTFTLSISAPNTTPGENATATENHTLTINSAQAAGSLTQTSSLGNEHAIVPPIDTSVHGAIIAPPATAGNVASFLSDANTNSDRGLSLGGDHAIVAAAIAFVLCGDQVIVPPVNTSGLNDHANALPVTPTGLGDSTIGSPIIMSAHHDATIAPPVTDAAINAAGFLSDANTNSDQGLSLGSGQNWLLAKSFSLGNEQAIVAAAVTSVLGGDQVIVPPVNASGLNDHAVAPPVTPTGLGDSTIGSPIITSAHHDANIVPPATDAASNAASFLSDANTNSDQGLSLGGDQNGLLTNSLSLGNEHVIAPPAVTAGLAGDQVIAPPINTSGHNEHAIAPPAVTSVLGDDQIVAPPVNTSGLTSTPSLHRSTRPHHGAIIVPPVMDGAGSAASFLSDANTNSDQGLSLGDGDQNGLLTNSISLGNEHVIAPPAVTAGLAGDQVIAPPVDTSGHNEHAIAPPAVTSVLGDDQVVAPPVNTSGLNEHDIAPPVETSVHGDINVPPLIDGAASAASFLSDANTDSGQGLSLGDGDQNGL